MDAMDEMQSEVSSFETIFASQSIEFADYSVQEIDKRLRVGNVGALVRTEKYSETFLYMGASLTADLAILNEGRFLPFSSAVVKKLVRAEFAASWLLNEVFVQEKVVWPPLCAMFCIWLRSWLT